MSPRPRLAPAVGDVGAGRCDCGRARPDVAAGPFIFEGDMGRARRDAPAGLPGRGIPGLAESPGEAGRPIPDARRDACAAGKATRTLSGKVTRVSRYSIGFWINRVNPAGKLLIVFAARWHLMVFGNGRAVGGYGQSLYMPIDGGCGRAVRQMRAGRQMCQGSAVKLWRHGRKSRDGAQHRGEYRDQNWATHDGQ